MRRSLASLVVVLLFAAACSADEPDLVPAEATGATPTATPTAPAEPTPTQAVEPDATGADEPTPTASEPAPQPDDAGTDQAPDGGATPDDDGALPPPTPSPTVAPTAVPATDQPCSEGLTGDPQLSATARADIDGDGAPDQITTYRIGPADSDPWRIRADTSAGTSYDSALDLSVVPGGVIRPIGGADVDGDATTDEIFTVVGAGAAVLIVAVHTVVGCELAQATIGGAPVGFPIGGSVANIGGLQCLDTDDNGVVNTVVAWSGVAADAGDGEFLVDGVEYELRGTELTQVGTRQLRADLGEADFVYSQLSCGAVTL